MAYPCKFCGAVSYVRTSRMLTRTVRETYCQCTDYMNCGEPFKVLSESVDLKFQRFRFGMKNPFDERQLELPGFGI